MFTTLSGVAAVGFVAIIVLLSVFQVSLVFGAPLGQFAWGGQHEGKLPVGYRIGSAISILIYGFLVTIVLNRAGLISLYAEGFAAVFAWIIFGYLVFGTLLNAISRSRSERNVMTPVALVLAVLAFIVAMQW